MFSKLSIAGRIYMSFAVMIGLLAGLIGLAMFGVQDLSGTLNGFRTSAQAAAQVRDMTAGLTRARLSVSTYSATPGPEVVARLGADLEHLKATGDAAGLVATVQTEIADYAGQVEEMVALDQVIEGQLATLETAGQIASQTLGDMIAQASQSANLNAKAAALAGLAMQNLLQVRLGVATLIEHPVDAGMADAAAQIAATRAALGDLRATFFKTDDLAQVDAVLVGVDGYEAALDVVFAQLQERRAMQTAIGQLEAALDKVFGVAAEANRATQAVTEQATVAHAGAIQFWVLVAGLMSLAVGVGMALGIARWLSGTIRSLARATHQLAAGDFTAVLPANESNNELGQIASALEIFAANGRALQQQDAEQAVEAEAQQARQTQRERLQSELAARVQQAAGGDFSQRMASDYTMDELAVVARNVNMLLATVERGLTETSEVLVAVADADLTQRVSGDYQGAFAVLKTSTNAVADKLSQIMVELRRTSRALKSATGEILSGANDLAERTTQQASAVDETSSAMAQLSQTVKANAGKAQDASQQASVVAQSADEGGAVMVEANQAMERISSASSQISNIIGMIDDIAFQTNLLALNASVEAARAGEAGKGFAVVAVEVRRLAQSAATASSDVKALIDTSASEVRNGSRLVAAAASKLDAVQTAVRSNRDLMVEIATESREQASAIEVAGEAIRRLDEMTQHNAALVEEINAAIEQTEGQASELDRVVDVFHVGEPRTGAVELRSAGTRSLPYAPRRQAFGRSGGAAAELLVWDEDRV